MKIRCVQNSVRIRIRKSELEQLKLGSVLTESVLFPNNQKFEYRLSINPENEYGAIFQNGALHIALENKEGKAWLSTEQVGVEFNLKNQDNSELHVLIEKDFPCLDRPEEDKSDTFVELSLKEKKDEDAC